MKAIVTVHKSSAFAHLNGKTFEIKDFMPSAYHANFGLVIDGNITDFSMTEILIVDIENEYQSAYDNNNFYGGIQNATVVNALDKYCRANKIKFTPAYNCPA